MIKLSVLINTIDERHEDMVNLYHDLIIQVGDYPVEILVLMDNKKRTIGEKRTSLLQVAKGEYVTTVDDDDDISDDYIDELMKAIESGSDVITFKQQASIDDETFTVTFGMNNENEQLTRGFNDKFVDIKRKPFHVCAWKRELVKDIIFPSANYSEDWAWCEEALLRVQTETHIDKVLHYYKFSTTGTRAT